MRKRVRRVLVLTVVLAAGVLVTTAAGAKPVKSPAPATDITGQYCEDFSVHIHVISDKTFVITFSSGRVMFAGTLKVRLTNVETDEAINLNVSGPGTFSSDGATLTLKGATLLSGETGFFGPGSPPRLSLNSGRTVIDLATGAVIKETGRSRDLCARLAA